MADTKIFAGPRIRRIRTNLELTQTAMASELGISPSYLNLIERNQRPLTVQLILKLSSTYKLDVGALQAETGSGTIPALKEIFSDPLLAGELPGDTEIVEMSDGAPNASAAVIKLYRAYREQQGRLTEMSRLLGREGHKAMPGADRLPIDETRDRFENQSACYPALEDAASRIFAGLETQTSQPRLFDAVKQKLRLGFGISVQILPSETMPNWRKRFDRHSKRLFLSDRLSHPEQFEAIAMELALLSERKLIDEEVSFLKLSTDEAERLARFELARYFAQAIMMPYDQFLSVSQRLRCDLDSIAARFDVSFAQAAYRLASLQRQGRSAVPIFIIEVDQAGNRIRRIGSRGFPFSRFGGECPKLPMHRVFASPGEVLVDHVVTPEEAEFILVARTLKGPRPGFGNIGRKRAILVGFDQANAALVLYADEFFDRKQPAPVEIGPSCRLCERPGCLSRAQPPITKPLGLDEYVTGLSAFDFQ